MNYMDPTTTTKADFLRRAADWDDETFLLVLESETNFMEEVDHIIEAIEELKCQSKAVGERIRDLNNRQDRIEGRIEKLKEYADKRMKAADLQKLKRPLGTLYYHTGYSTVVDDIGLIPDGYLRRPPPEAMKELIKASIRAGKDVPGAHLETSKTLCVRT